MKAIALLLVALLASCGDDASVVSSSLELEFQVRGQDVDGDGTLVDQVAIDLSEEAPWRIFSDRITNDFGQNPGDLVLNRVSMRLLDTSQGVQDLGDVFNGPITFRFRIGGNQNEYTLAIADIRAASEATQLDDFLVEFNYSLIDEQDRAKIVGGDMQTLFVGQAGDDFRNTSSVAELSARFEFTAVAPAEPSL